MIALAREFVRPTGLCGNFPRKPIMKTRMKNAPLNVNFLRSLPTTAAARGNTFGVNLVVGGFDC